MVRAEDGGHSPVDVSDHIWYGGAVRCIDETGESIGEGGRHEDVGEGDTLANEERLV